MKMIFCSIPALKIKLLFVFIFLSLLISANNIQIKSPARVVDVSGGMATIEVSVSWENSWRDAENWDAAYLFLKYKKSGGNWAHVGLQAEGHTISSPYACMTAAPKGAAVPGIFIYRNELGSGAANVTCRLKWACSYSQEQFDNGEVQVLAQAVEMVYVPAGSYVLGDSLSANCFADAYGKPLPIHSESSNIGLGYIQEGGVYQKVTVAASYPKGYQGMYMMKYELSQEQYVNFLNTLTLAQQKALLPDWNKWKEGNYIFGNTQKPSGRNGIIMAFHADAASPMIFANNFNPANEYNQPDDGQTLACNYMSIYDLLAYASWAGLRPMSEMEFEKACRLPYPALQKGGYAWNGIAGTTSKAMALSGEGSEGETVGVGNVNFKKSFEGPLRCGIFAKSSSSAQASGSTYWGIMEMSGNVRELCRNVNDWYFYWNRHGAGTYNPALWNTTLSYYGVRGGGFTSEAEELQVSDRSQREYFNGKSVTFRDSTIGFRMVRTMELGAVDLNPGTIKSLTTICPNVTLKIESTAPASVSGMSNLPIRYEWYLNSVRLEGQTADTLVYNNWQPGTYYNFVRKAVCAIGEKNTNTIRVYVSSPALDAGVITGGSRCAPGVLKVGSKTPANMTCGYPIVYRWYIDNVLVKDSVGETLTKEWEVGTYRVVRRASSFGLIKDAATTVTVTALNLKPGEIYGGMVMETVEQTVTNVKSASVGCGNIKYTWYVDSVLVPGASGAELKHAFDTAGFYQVIRRATADNGEYADAMDTVIVNSKTAICGKSNGTVVDDEENVYTVLPMADDRCWMTQNMRRRDISHRHAGNGAGAGFDGDNIKLHEGEQPNDKAYGLHYNWKVMMQNANYPKAQGICPAGWYIPTEEEWRTLEMAYGMTYAQANATGWRGSNQGTQFKVGGTAKFNMTYSGVNGNSNFSNYGYYWTSSTYSGNSGYAYLRHIYSSKPTIYRSWQNKSDYLAVRCIRSMCMGGQKPSGINPGVIQGGTAGVGFPYKIKAVKTATVSCGGLIYSWYINDTLVPGQGASLTHVFAVPGTYKVVRRATADDDTYADTSAIVRVFPACGVKNYVLDDQENKYSIKEMADARCWMTQNMRRRDITHRHAGNAAGVGFDGDNIKLHEGELTNDKAHGLHYTWAVAMQNSSAEKAQGICPAGWYIPTDLEWRQLEMAYGMTSAQANGTGWRGYNEGTRFKAGGNSGFNATLSGVNGNTNFSNYGYYWTSSTYSGNTGYAYFRHFYNNNAKVYRSWQVKTDMLSVRCIRSMCYDNAPKDVKAGEIKGGSISVNYPLTIKGTKTATVSCGGLEYSWYVDGKQVAGAEGASLTYTFTQAGVYYVIRRATADNGDYADVKVKVVVYAPCGKFNYVHDSQGNKYNIKEMADARCWMIQNMRRRDVNHRHAGNAAAVDNDGTNVRLHNGVQANDVAHGAHYTWAIAMQNSTAQKAQGICPPGWYIPTDAEWLLLERAYGMTVAQSNGTGWRGFDEGTKFKPKGSAGFNATLSGVNGNANFSNYGYYWTSTTYSGNTGYAYFRHFYSSNAKVYRSWQVKTDYLSVRCIRSRCEEGEEPDTVLAGAIVGGVSTPGYSFTIKNSKGASVSCGGLYYSWYIDGNLIENEVGETLTYVFDLPKTYQIVRRATSDNGLISDAKAQVTLRTPCAGRTTVVDDQGYSYPIKAMADNRCWMTRNMRRTDISHRHVGNGAAADHDATNVRLHNGVQGNDLAHGVHYTWAVAMQNSSTEKAQGICPPGWYIPTDGEWLLLERAYGMTVGQSNGTGWRGFDEGTKLKAGGSAGFNVTLSGFNATSNVSSYGYYWTSTTYSGNTGYAYFRHFYNSNAKVYRSWQVKTDMLSVRCIRATCNDSEPQLKSAGKINGGSAAAGFPFTVKSAGTATATCGGLYYSWYVDTKLVPGAVSASLTYTFTEAGTHKVIRRVTLDNGQHADAVATVIIYSPCMGNTIVYDDLGYSYPIKEMADARCWMTRNMRRTDINHRHAGNAAAVDNDGTNVHLHDGVQANDVAHGIHYTWAVAMQNSSTEKAQGICPPGWYIPTDAEWLLLERAYGMTVSQSNGTGWRGFDEGTKLKAGGSAGFNVTLSGFNGNTNFSNYGYYWTSTTYSGNTGYAYFRHFYSSNAKVYRSWQVKTDYLPVRCIRSSCYGDTTRITSAGTIQGGTTGVGYAITIKNTKTATVSCGGLKYSWFIDGKEVAGVVSASLTYTFNKTGKYKVIRRVTADDGKQAETSAMVNIYSPCAGQTTVIDDQGYSYPVKEMADNRCWMTRNMRRTDISHRHVGNGAAADHDATNVRLHNGVQGNDVAHGVHYTWAVAMQNSTAQKAQGICPPGWYIPTDGEWLLLERAYGMTVGQSNGTGWRGFDEGKKLKAGGSAGFNATLSGFNATSNVSSYGYYWTSTTYSGNTGYAYFRHLYKDKNTMYRSWQVKTDMLSVRCIRATCYDSEPQITSAGSISGGVTSVGYPITIKNTKTAATTCGGIKYSWYVDGSLISGAIGASLKWTPQYANTYEIVRRATLDEDPDKYKETKTTVTVYSPCAGKTYVYDDQGHRYPIKEMADTRCWMIRNLYRTDVVHRHANNAAAAGFDGDNIRLHEGVFANDTIHGAHYTWAVAMQNSSTEKAQGICPPGWYIPTDGEWLLLERAYGMTVGQSNGTGWRGFDEGTKLKAGGNTGFNATLSGFNGNSNFSNYGYYWTSTTYSGNTGYAYFRHFYKSNAKAYRSWQVKTDYLSVRCIRSQCYNGATPQLKSAGKITGGKVGVNYPFIIKNAGTATVSCGGIEYSWFINRSATPLKNQVGSSLKWTFTAPGKYVVTRRATDDFGKYIEVSDSVLVYSPCAGNKTVYDDQGNVYNIKEMADTRCWMTQNLRRTDITHRHAGSASAADHDATNAHLHDGHLANDVAHGIHYTWAVAMQSSTAQKAQGICPPGWYIPTDGEWLLLERAYGMTVGQSNGTGWRGYNEGTRFKAGGNSGFNVSLSGLNGNSNFSNYGYYWTSTTYSGNNGYAYFRHFYSSNAKVYRSWQVKTDMLSVRCIRSQCYGTTEKITSAGKIIGGKVGVNYPFTIKNGGTATVNCGGVEYSWFVDGALQAGEVGASLTYTFTKTGAHTIKRVATADNGHYLETVASVIVTAPCGGAKTVTDAQGNVYNIKEMADTRCWMIQNMRRRDVTHRHAGNAAAAGVEGSSTHNGILANDVAHGLHYSWAVAMRSSSVEKAQGICPTGWHVPSDGEWLLLERAYGMTVGQSNGTGWRGYNEGTRFKAGGNSGFNVSLSGLNGNSNFSNYGYYWTSTTYSGNNGYAYFRHFYSSNAKVYRSWQVKTDYLSVRCIKNE